MVDEQDPQALETTLRLNKQVRPMPAAASVPLGIVGGVALGLPLTTAGLTLLSTGVAPLLGMAVATFGVGVLLAVAGFVGWSLGNGGPLPEIAPRPRTVGPTVLVFGCAQAPTTNWSNRLVELDPSERRAMAERAPRGGTRWVADLLRTLEHHRGTLDRLILVVDDASYNQPILSALDRLVRAHVDPPRGTEGRAIAIEHLVLEDPEDPELVFVAVSGKLHELMLRPTGRKRIAVAPNTGWPTTNMALTLAASTHHCELLYFRGSPREEAPKCFDLHH